MSAKSDGSSSTRPGTGMMQVELEELSLTGSESDGSESSETFNDTLAKGEIAKEEDFVVVDHNDKGKHRRKGRQG